MIKSYRSRVDKKSHRRRLRLKRRLAKLAARVPSWDGVDLRAFFSKRDNWRGIIF